MLKSLIALPILLLLGLILIVTGSNNVDEESLGVSSVQKSTTKASIIDFKQMSVISQSDDPMYTILDVRETSEYESGHIPHAHNMPFFAYPDALGLDASEFNSTFGFEKPALEQELVIYCQSGVRAGKADKKAAQYGYDHRMVYSGSFKDWQKHKGEIEY